MVVDKQLDSNKKQTKKMLANVISHHRPVCGTKGTHTRIVFAFLRNYKTFLSLLF